MKGIGIEHVHVKDERACSEGQVSFFVIHDSVALAVTVRESMIAAIRRLETAEFVSSFSFYNREWHYKAIVL
ncbi:hypothetical protein [Duncaniella muris]|uniref:hypothetical protein n=1 Tax=Duncaniella muris TaxID=2094150 RepID=UPI003F680FF9